MNDPSDIEVFLEALRLPAAERDIDNLRQPSTTRQPGLIHQKLRAIGRCIQLKRNSRMAIHNLC